jgi:hypothetical protein
MSLKDHIKSGLAGIALTSGLVASAGLICLGMGVLGGVAGMAALGVPMLIGGGGIWLGISLGSRLCGGLFKQGDQVKHMTFFAGMALTAYCMLGNYGPTQNAVPYGHKVFGNRGELSQRFHRAVREVNKHIIWPDTGLKPVHQRPPEP